MDVDAYPFSRGFRIKLLSLCIEPLWISKFTGVIRPEYFEADDERAVASAILEYREKYKKLPRDPDDLIQLCDGEDVEDLVYDIFDHDFDNDLAKDVAIQWAREQAAKLAILDSVDDVKRGDLQSVISKMRDALAVGDSLLSPGIDVVRDVEHWLYEQWVDKVATGLIHIDNHLDGGLGVGELGCVLAPTNRGKSAMLVNIAYGAAGLGSKKNVVVFTHEMRPKTYAKRFGARMLFRFPKRHDDLEEYQEEFLETARRMMPGSVRIVGGAKKMSTVEIEDTLKRLSDEGFVPDLVVDDYADLIIPPRQYNQRRFELTAIYEWLRSLGGEYNVPVWTASQVGRGAYTKEVITEADVAEDIGKVNTADVVMAICQTREESAKDRARLYLAKVRDASRGKMYDAKYIPSSQAFVTLGETKEREEADA